MSYIGFELMSVLFPVVFLVMFGIYAVKAIQSLLDWRKNNQSPRLIVAADVIGKRTNVTRRSSTDSAAKRTRTSYYATFRFETGDRLELELRGHEYGLLAEGDKGKLTFQGTRFLGFERII